MQLKNFHRLEKVTWWVFLLSAIPYGFLYGWEVGITIWLCAAMFCALILALLAPIKPVWLRRYMPLSILGLVILEQALLTIG
ncbi:DUF3325 family protein [Microbulbifer epialgicus]|uniref:DUF3325 family protein n=1 Tax=Microbulbifer epialgicus TaxID=393907 RepID=A0ABV4P201_9GAMM